MPLHAGQVFAGYTIERVLGSGGMGVVYLARHPRLERSVALKVLDVDPAADPKARAAFDREAALAASLEHPNIVPVQDRSGPGDPALWLAIRHVAGGDASALLSTAPTGLDPVRAVRLITDVAHALDFAHRHNVLHRDVKPANLLIENDPRHGERALLTDFGIARALDGRTTDTAVSATFAYVAPERFTSRPTDHRADQYSLGCTLYHLLTGLHPFPYRDEAAVIAAHLNAPPPAPSRQRPDLPPELDTVVATALAKDPALRYPRCVDLAAAAAHALAQPGVLPRTPRPARTDSAAPQRMNRRRLLIGAVAVPVAGTTVAATAALVNQFADPSAPDSSGGALTEPETPIQDNIFTGHTAIAGAVACSPRGSLLASGSLDSTVRLWSIDTGQQIFDPLTGHTAEVGSVAFSPDGARLASGSSDASIQLWNTATGERDRAPLTGHRNEVWSVAFSPDGTLLASGGADTTIRLWNADSGEITRSPLTGHQDQVWSVAFNPDGTLLASGSADRTVRLWDLTSGSTAGRTVTVHEGKIWSVAFSPDGTLLASGGADSAVRLWNIHTGELRMLRTGHDGAGWSVAFSPDGTLLATGSADHTIRLWNIGTGEPDRPPLTGHIAGVRSVAFGPGATFLASASEDTNVRLWAR